MTLLKGEPGTTYALKEIGRDRSCSGVADEDGIIRNENGEAFSDGAYTILEVLDE